MVRGDGLEPPTSQLNTGRSFAELPAYGASLSLKTDAIAGVGKRGGGVRIAPTVGFRRSPAVQSILGQHSTRILLQWRSCNGRHAKVVIRLRPREVRDPVRLQVGQHLIQRSQVRHALRGLCSELST